MYITQSYFNGNPSKIAKIQEYQLKKQLNSQFTSELEEYCRRTDTQKLKDDVDKKGFVQMNNLIKKLGKQGITSNQFSMLRRKIQVEFVTAAEND